MVRKFKNFAHGILAQIAVSLYGNPSRKILTIGVTGTDGKTTTASLIFHILKTAGFNPAMITTVGAEIAGQEYETGLHTTTPSAFFIQKYIKRAIDAGANYLVLETTSHALDQNRVLGIDFKIGVLTNISHEHLDYHGTYDEYVKAKSKLFKKSEIAILNLDDESYSHIKHSCGRAKISTYSLKKKADFTPKGLGIKLPGQFEFNFENFLAAASVAKVLGVETDKIQLALNSFKFPQGRQEMIYDKDFRVIIDFAHTPNSFQRILPVLKKAASGRLIHVFGAAGLRDASKRPLMGKIASENDDIIILTSEDPRSEGVEKINEQIKLGIKDKAGDSLFEIGDRQKAIDLAISQAKKGDIVVVTGKGHERSMNMGHGEIPWSDQAAVEEALKRK